MNGYSQIVPSDCTAPDSIVQKYFTDAQRLALRRVLSSGSNYTDSVRIPVMWTDTSLNALLAVYNADLPARDTVIQFFNIHTWADPFMISLIVQLDTNYSWAYQLSQGNLNTGNSTIDGLITEYGMTIYDIDLFPFGVYVTFVTDSNYNVVALSNAFESVAGVILAESNGVGGDGADITDNVTADLVSLTYSYGWGDCPAGCINRRYWQFNIDHDCNVEFAGSYGSPIDFPVPTSEPAPAICEIKIYPNPGHEHITLETMSESRILIENMNGLTILTLTTESPKEIISLRNFPCGMYIVRVYSPNGDCSVGKFLKE